MGATLEGNQKITAAQLGLSVDEYLRRRAAGLKWCTRCKAWQPVERFTRDRSRHDGLSVRCIGSDRGRPRPTRIALHEQARKKVASERRAGRLAHPSSVPCTDCGHLGPDRRHEHDHYLGYEPEHWLDVQVVCTPCHADREVRRRAT